MDNNGWPSRLYALDVSRGLAALSVVLWHWQHFAYRGDSLSPDFARESQPLYGVLRLFYEEGAMGVDYFFLLSGFIFFWLYRVSVQNGQVGPRTFAVHRFSRLYPLHFVTLLVVASLQLLYISRQHVSFVYPFNDAYHFFLNLGLASTWGFESGDSFNGPVWAVSIEVLLYVGFFIVALFRRGGWLFSLFVSIGSFACFYFVRHTLLLGLALFFLGGVVFRFTSLVSTTYRFLRVPVYVLTLLAWSCVIIRFYLFDLAAVIMGFGVAGNVFLKGFPRYVLFPLTICSLALVEMDRGAFLKRMSWVGEISYSSYLLHFPLQLSIALAATYGLLDAGFYRNPLYLGLYLGILIPLSYLVHINFERPVQKLIRSRLIGD